MEYEKHKNITPITLSIDRKEEKRNQLIYASQLYGTFFAVSAQLQINKEGKLTGMKLALINYKGLFNLGILDLTSKFKIDSAGKASLKLHLSAFRGTHGNGKSISVNCEPFLVKNLSELEVTRELHSFAEYQDGVLGEHLDDRCFDNEFYERDGAAIYRRDRMDDGTAKIVAKDVGKHTPDSNKTGECMTSNCQFV